MKSALLVFLGGGAGSVLRWAVSQALSSPAGTLFVNVVGSAVLAALLHPQTGVSDAVRLGVGAGVLGGFTTYSTFNTQVVAAIQAGEIGRGLGLAALTFATCLVAGLCGWSLAGLRG